MALEPSLFLALPILSMLLSLDLITSFLRLDLALEPSLFLALPILSMLLPLDLITSFLRLNLNLGLE